MIVDLELKNSMCFEKFNFKGEYLRMKMVSNSAGKLS